MSFNIQKKNYTKNGNFYKIPIISSTIEARQVIKTINKPCYVNLGWNNCGTTVYSNKYQMMRPPTDLSFTVGICYNTRPGDFGYTYYKENGWYICTFYICSKHFPDYEIKELQKVIKDIKFNMTGKNITLNTCLNNPDIYFGDNVEELISNIESRVDLLCNALKTTIINNFQLNENEVDVSPIYKTSTSIFQECMRNIDKMNN